MLYAMQYFMTKSITILRDLSGDVLNSLPRPTQLEYACNPNLRLINIQIKHEMYFLIRKTYLDVLEELDKQMRRKDPTLWAPTFCCIMILCMCAERVQTNTDFRILSGLDEEAAELVSSSAGLDNNNSSSNNNNNNNNNNNSSRTPRPSRDESIDVCRKLDNQPIASAISLFHMVYRTNKVRDSSKKREESFNPIRDGLEMVRKAKLGQDVEEFVSRIRAVVAEHRE